MKCTAMLTVKGSMVGQAFLPVADLPIVPEIDRHECLSYRQAAVGALTNESG